MEKPFFSFDGEKCCNTTILDPQQLETVDVGLTFQSFVGATFISFVGPTVLVSQHMKRFLRLGSQNLYVQQNFHNKRERE